MGKNKVVVADCEGTLEDQLADHLGEALEGVTEEVVADVGLDETHLTLLEASVDLELDHHVEAVAVDGGLAGEQHGAAEGMVAATEGVEEHVEHGDQLAVACVLQETLEAGSNGHQAVLVGGVTGDAVADLDGPVAAERLDAVGVGHIVAVFLLDFGVAAVGGCRCIFPKIRSEV